MSDRSLLIARKQEVRQQIERLRRQLEQVRSQGENAPQRRIRSLEDQLERLMATEMDLRLAIDRSR